MNFNAMQWFDFNIFIFMGMSLVLNASIVYLWHKKFYQKIGLKSYKTIQRIHLYEVPRLGGLVFSLSLISYVLYSHTNESIQLLKLMLICLIPIIIIGAKEDLFHNVKPAIRLLSLFFVGWLFLEKFMEPLPNIADMPVIGKLIALKGGVAFFYILSMAVVANGMNFIDGVNGLCVAAALSILAALLLLCYKTNDVVMISIIFNIILIIIPFLIFNYPFGKIFLGDLGAYILGLLLGMLTIIFFGRHPEISPWVAMLILIYPVTEVSYTLLRRAIKGDAVHYADKSHLHLKFFCFFRRQLTYKKMANGLVAPFLTIIWIFPVLAISWVYHKTIWTLIAITFFFVLYTIFYISITIAKRI
jgi:UDP-GlcNAc:undecaprenyl-phosphate GlcNAc-1-phosphate transferase